MGALRFFLTNSVMFWHGGGFLGLSCVSGETAIQAFYFLVVSIMLRVPQLAGHPDLRGFLIVAGAVVLGLAAELLVVRPLEALRSRVKRAAGMSAADAAPA